MAKQFQITYIVYTTVIVEAETACEAEQAVKDLPDDELVRFMEYSLDCNGIEVTSIQEVDNE